MKFFVVILLTALVCGTPAAGAPTALTGGTLHPVSGPAIPGGVIIIDGGRITAVGTDAAIPADAERVDIAGLHVYPGMIAANTVLGLTEVNSVKGTRDDSETGDINPNLRAVVALNADSELIPVARANGVLTVLSVTNGGLISGTSAVWNLQGWNWEDMTVLDDAALHIRWPNMAASARGGSADEQKKAREKKLQALKDAFADARAYLKARGAEGSAHPEDVRWEAMAEAIQGRRKVIIHADEYLQIESALDFAGEHELDIIIAGGRDAPKLSDRLAAESVPVIINSVLTQPRRSWEPYDAAYTVAAELHQAGVPFCISMGASAFTASNIRNLPYHAAMAAAFGLPKEEALRSVTLSPAEILGIEDRLGSLDEGKDANLIVTTGDPLEITSNVVYAWIAGEPVDLSSRHTRLYDKYRNRPRVDGRETRLEPAPAGR